MAYCVFCMNEIDVDICNACGKSQENYIAAPHHLKPNTVLNGKYIVGSVLGEGGFGITYIGKDLNLDLKVAIKEYYPSGMVNRNTQTTSDITANIGNSQAVFEKGKKSFLSEARTLAKFADEPNVVTVRDFFEENNTAYIIMDYLEGVDLKTHLSTSGVMSFEDAFKMLSPVMTVLERIHTTGLIHRDISPANIMMLKNGTVKLLDFGAARDFSGADEKSLSVMLKPGYAPEEQYRSKGSQGPWTDVYAISATLYKMVTGVTPDDAMNRLFSDEVQPPSELNPTVTKTQSEIILKGMSVFQNDRYSSISELQNACKEALNDNIHSFNKKAIIDDERTISDVGKSVNTDDENTIIDFENSKQVTEEELVTNFPAEREVYKKTDEKSEYQPTPIGVPVAVNKNNNGKKPRLWGLIGSIIAGIIADLELFVAVSSSLSPETVDSTGASGFIPVIIFGLIAAGFGYFYYPRVEKNKQPNKKAFIASIVLTVIAVLITILGVYAFGDDAGGSDVGGTFMSMALSVMLPAVYLGYFYYPRLEKKLRKKYISIYGSAVGIVAVLVVIFTVFTTLSTISVGDQKIKTNAQSVEINADLLTDADIEKLATLKNLTSLSIQACLLDDADVKIIGQMTQLEELSLVGNTDISDISPLGNLKNLTFLNLQHTGAKDISALSKLTNLTQLSISQTEVKDVSALENLTKLEILYLNELENLDETTIKLPNTINSLYCNANKLTNVNFLKELNLLSTLDISNNALTDISPINSKLLSMVNISGNQITDITSVSNTSIQLKAENNKITDISCLKGFRGGTLSLSNNSISDLTPLKDNDKISNLDLSFNNITDISALKDCFNISILTLNDNKIADISALATIDKLSTLNLNNNSIQDISPLAQNQNFINSDSAIYLENNQISDITALGYFNKVESFHLNGNQISNLSPLASCTAMKRLYANNNLITDLSPISSMLNLRVVMVVGKPIENIANIRLKSTDNIVTGSILSVTYNEAINWSQVKSLGINTLRVYDISPRKKAEMEELGIDTYHTSDSLNKEETEDNGNG